MTIDELIGKINILPINVKKDNEVLPQLRETLTNYERDIHSLEDFPYADKVKGINKILLRAYEYYYNGMPNKAYLEIKKLFKHKGLKDFISIDYIHKVGHENEYKQLYRARVGEDIYELTDIFHNPFNNRHMIPTYRYSIPGFPCLYLSGSIYGCWIELNKPDLNKMFVSRFEANKNLRILNLATLPQDIYKLNVDKFNKYLVTWPIICACSISVKDSNRTFKSEYIIPQLLLQALRELKDIDGIRYFSVKADYTKVRCNSVYINYVFPADINDKVEINGNQYSKYLIENFKLTPPINVSVFNNLNMAGISTIEITALNRRENEKDKEIIKPDYFYRGQSAIEIAKGYRVEYRGVNFYRLEETLCKMPAEQIKCRSEGMKK